MASPLPSGSPLGFVSIVGGVSVVIVVLYSQSALNAFGRLRLRRCLLKTQVGHRPTHSLAHPIDRATNGEATPIPDPTFNGSTATTPPLDPLGLGGRGWGAPPTPPTTHGAAATRTPPNPGGLPQPRPPRRTRATAPCRPPRGTEVLSHIWIPCWLAMSRVVPCGVLRGVARCVRKSSHVMIV